MPPETGADAAKPSDGIVRPLRPNNNHLWENLMTEQNRILCRELSLLAFNRRVLAQAEDKNVPLLERLRFLCIVSSNLDEFFEVRMAWLKRENKLHPRRRPDNGKMPSETIADVTEAARSLIRRPVRPVQQRPSARVGAGKHPFLPPPQLDGHAEKMDRRLFRPRTAADPDPHRTRPFPPFPAPAEQIAQLRRRTRRHGRVRQALRVWRLSKHRASCRALFPCRPNCVAADTASSSCRPSSTPTSANSSRA